MNLVKVTVLGCLLLGMVGCERNPRLPAYEFIPDMAHAVPYESFSKNPNTPDGKTLQAPVRGTIPRGFMPYPFPKNRKRAGRALKNPTLNSETTLERGKQLYETFCLVCHGEGGEGDGPLIPKFPNPPSFKTKKVRDLPVGELYHVITMGSGDMASYASQIKPEDRWKIVRYIQTLQGRDKKK